MAYVPILVGGMLFTGSSNSLWTKYQDMSCVENCGDSDPANRVYFEQPVWQTLQMFVGEFACFIPVLFTYLRHRHYAKLRQSEAAAAEAENTNGSIKPQRAPLKGWKVLLFWLPAVCDLTATTLMNIGLLFTPVSIYQMTRGALVLFVGIFSVLFLKRRLFKHQWFALAVVVAGVAVVGLSGSLTKQALAEQPNPETGEGVLLFVKRELRAILKREEPTEAGAVVIGVFFTLFAQIFTATQFVLEESIMSHYSTSPLAAVGYEGFFGLSSTLLLFPIISHFKDRSVYFDLPRGYHQMVDNPRVLGSSFAIATSIGFYNFFGMSVTRHVSATMRSIIDTLRTITIWMISLALGWEQLVWPWSLLQVVGFSLLVYGTFLFNSLIAPPSFLRPEEIIEYSALPTEEGDDGGLERSVVIEDRQGAVGRSLDEAATLPADAGVGYDVIPPASGSVKPRRD